MFRGRGAAHVAYHHEAALAGLHAVRAGPNAYSHLCDLSPSASAHLTVDEYAARMRELHESLRDKGKVSWSTSHGSDSLQPESGVEVEAMIKAKGFHRAGTRLGAALKALLAQASDVDRLFIVTDRDQHSWGGFNWRFLLDEMDVVFYDLTADREKLNVYVSEARFLAAPASETMAWEIDVAVAKASKDEQEGKLDVTYMGQSLGSYPWRLAPGKTRLAVRVEWPASRVAEIDPSGARDVPVVFRLASDQSDAVASDNEFRADLLGLKQDVLLVSEAAGERLLEDPAEQLEVALQIQGFRLRRQDFVTQPGPAPGDYPFVVLLGGGDETRYCPRSIERARLASQVGGKAQTAMPKVWLAPQSPSADYRALCRCYASLLLTKSAEAGEPPFCQHVETHSAWIGLLPSLGAKQIGGGARQ